MRHFTLPLAVVCALALPVHAQETASEENAAPDYDAATVVAKVNGKEITIGHMIAVMERLPEQYSTLGDEVLFPGILDQLIDQVALADSVSKSAATDQKRTILTMENERHALLAKQAVDAVVAEGLDEALIEAEYDKRYADLPVKMEYNASHILVETAEDAQAVIAELDGGAEFADVAKEKSTGPSGPEGGNLGWFGEGVMVPEFEAAVTGMEVGAVSEPVQTQFGWHVIKLNETRDVPPPTLEDVRAEITNQLMQQHVESVVDGIRSDASIERMELDIPFDAVRNSELID